MSRLFFADGFDPGDWIYLVLLALGAVGSVLGKKKKDANRRKAEADAQRARASRPRAPAAPRPPQVPQPTRPPTLPPAPGRARPARRIKLQPVGPGLGEAERRWLQVEAAPRRVEPGVGGPGEVSEPTAAVPILAETERSARPPVCDSAQFRAVRRALGSDRGLRRAVILSEILAPPVALRENHPF